MEDDGFIEKKASEYVARIGEESAIKKLSGLASKSVQARKMLQVITSGLEQNQPQPVVQRDSGFVYRTASVSKMALDPKPQFLNKICLLGISCDTPMDENWNPVVAVKWTDGQGFINGHRVTFGKEYLEFMRKRVLHRQHIVFNMHVLNVNDHGVVAEPDTDDYYKRKSEEYHRRLREKRRGEKEEQEAREKSRFEASIFLGKRGIYIKSTAVSKRIVVPQRFMSELLVNRGTWLFEPIDERSDSIVAAPVECLEKSTETQEQHISDQRMGALINGDKVSL